MLRVADSSGNEYEINQHQAMSLIQAGLDSLNQTTEPENTPEPPSEDLTLEEQVKQLNQRITEKEAKEKEITEKNRILTELDTASKSFDLLKTHSELTNGIKAEALARQSLNPKINLQTAMAAAVKDRQDLIDKIEKQVMERMKNTNIIGNSNNGILRSGGGVPAIDTDKQYTAEDVRKGGSRAALQALLESGG